MANLKHIGHKILIFAIIAAILNVYAFEFGCHFRHAALGPAAATAGAHDHGGHEHEAAGQAGGHDHAAPHSHSHSDAGDHAAGDQDGGCCKNQTSNFFSSLQAPSWTKIHLAPLKLATLFPVWLASFQTAMIQPRLYSWPYHPDVGLRPKIPDIRIFLCSLTV
ncbi:MAG: hypothetical protein ACO1O1_02415 [Adhaeribacter sp.]